MKMNKLLLLFDEYSQLVNTPRFMISCPDSLTALEDSQGGRVAYDIIARKRSS